MTDLKPGDIVVTLMEKMMYRFPHPYKIEHPVQGDHDGLVRIRMPNGRLRFAVRDGVTKCGTWEKVVYIALKAWYKIRIR